MPGIRHSKPTLCVFVSLTHLSIIAGVAAGERRRGCKGRMMRATHETWGWGVVTRARAEERTARSGAKGEDMN